MWGLVENLGLKEGIADFREQFNKDAKATIANTQFAKERGIDVACLDSWEHSLQQNTAEIHERTIKRAVETLAHDETIAHLLELEKGTPTNDTGPNGEEVGAETELAVEGSPAAELSPAAGGAGLASLGETSSDSELAAAFPTMESDVHEVTSCEGLAKGVEAIHAGGTYSASRESEHLERSRAGAASVDGAPAHAGAARPVVRRQQASPSPAVSYPVDEQLAAAHAQYAELEARWAELSVVSDEALQQAQEAKQQVALLRQAANRKNELLAQAENERERLSIELGRAERERAEIESQFQERLEREVSQKEQELLDEVAYLRKTGEVKERRVQELVEEKAQLERKLVVVDLEGGGSTPGREAMIEAHTTIARAFGAVATEHPLVRVIDEPLLKLTSFLFRQAAFRRAFFALSAMMWLFALRHAVHLPQS